MSPEDQKEYGIVANVLSDKVLRTGARVWILYCNGDAEFPKVMGLSKSGRKVTKYTAYKRLTTFRAAWVPEHLRDQVSCYTKQNATQRAKILNEVWTGVRFFHRDGHILQDGISANQRLDEYWTPERVKDLQEKAKQNGAQADRGDASD